MSKRVVLLLVLFAVTVCAVAEVRAKTLGGMVTDNSGAVIANADITLVAGDEPRAPRKYTRTDESGHYSFADVEASSISLRVTKDGKVPNKVTFCLKSNEDGVLVIDIVAQ